MTVGNYNEHIASTIPYEIEERSLSRDKDLALIIRKRSDLTTHGQFF